MAEHSDLARRVADELEIRNLVARVAQLADSGAIDAYAALYTDDAVWEMPASPATGLEASARRGTADIVAGVQERRAAGVQGPGSQTRHVVTTVSVELDGADAATAHSYWTFWSDTATTPTPRTMGEYQDAFQRTDGGWRLAHRTIIMG